MDATAYLARPVDQAHHRSQELDRVCAFICTVLTGHGYRVYRPANAWQVPATTPPNGVVEDVNGLALRSSDLLVAYLPAEVPTIGVPMEIQRALSLAIPVIAICDAPSYALARPGLHVINGVFDGQLADILAKIADRINAARCVRLAGQDERIRLVVRGGHELPSRTYPDDAGLDLTTVKEYVIEPGHFVDIHTQVDAVQLPAGYWGMITGRSSTLRRHKLHVPLAVIDPGWRGPLFIGVWNLGTEPRRVEPGDRLGQLILLPCNPAQVLAVDAVADAPRGTAGFGSSG